MKKLLGLILGLAMLAAIVPAASAQISVCGGNPGVRFYEHTGYGGGSITFCANSVGVIQDANLSNNTSGLGFGATWNDRVSSLRTYNFSSTKRIRFYPSSNYTDANTAGPDRYVTSTGNVSLSNLGIYWPNDFDGGFNDKMTSFRTLP